MDAVQVSLAVLTQTAGTTGSSKTEIKNFIEESDSRLASIEAQIAALLERRDCERATGFTLRALIAPIRSLPTELLAEIFMLSIRAPIPGQWSRQPYIQDAFRMAHVSSHWRRVAVGTPRLWAGPIRALRGMFYADGLKLWLARSEPLSIPISCKDTASLWDSYDSPKPYNPRIIQELLRIAPRWRSLRLDGHVRSSFLEEFSPESRFDNLTELNLESLSPFTSNSDSMIFAATPLLRTFKAPADTNFPVPWAQLTDLTLLLQCPNLIRLKLVTAGWESQLRPARTEMIVHSRLRTLSLHFEDHHFMPFFDALSVPALKKLVLRFNDRDLGDWGTASFTAFQLRSPHITRMELHRSNMTSQDLQIALGHAPALTHLKTCYCMHYPNSTLLLALSCTDGVEPLVPSLNYLGLLEMPGNGSELSQTALADMIASRSSSVLGSENSPHRAVARLTRVKLSAQTFKFSEAFVHAMEDLKRDGLDVFVHDRV
ncbi:hypothetical protein B0H14DRAFT_2684575 [Mycena olivaceomarginata]|nr:hypothetical protein B0H14DRAFT_2684575 [Mycena olivaceomarginata]